jgi:hypothetical protein
MTKNSFIKLSILIFFLLFINITAQNKTKIEKLKSSFAKGENKEKYYTNLVKNANTILNSELELDFNQWSKAFRDAQSIFLKNATVYNGLSKALSLAIDKNLKLQRISLEVAYTLYETELKEQVLQIFKKTTDPTSFAIAVHYLKRINYRDKKNIFYIETLKRMFPKFEQNEVLIALINDLIELNSRSLIKLPSLSELLNHDVQNGTTIIYSFHRKNRNYPGITIIKKPNGEFVRNEDGNIFNIPQLAISYSNLPGYIPNGNTPQGIYSVVGWYISPTETIGPTPNVLLRSPLEVSPKIFYHGKNKFNNWTLDEYKNLLPESWLKYLPIYQSYYAGMTGRKLIIMHGSTDETDYFQEKLYYPLTPTRGCLSSKEIWSKKTGKCLESDQSKLINALKSTGQKKGFLVVLEIDDQQKAVNLEELKSYIK